MFAAGNAFVFVIVSVLPDALNVVFDEFKLIRSPAAAPEPLFARTDTTKSVFDLALKVSFESAVTINCPLFVEFTTNCLRKVAEVTDELPLVSVFSVLILFFLNFLRRRFLFWS